jgi:hypothetical protein
MANAVSGPGSAPDTYDWFADFAEEEPAADEAASETLLIDRASAFDGWSSASATPASPIDYRAEPVSAVRLPRHGGAMRLIALAAAIVALAAWWIVPRLAQEVTVPSLPPQPAPLPAPPLPAPPPLDSAPAVAAPVAAAPPPVVAPAVVAPPSEEAPAIEDVLGRYRAAFGALDVNRVAEVWPGADRAALERTFTGLTFQSLEFAPCSIEVRDLDARATCHGRTRLVTKAAAKTFLEPRQWEFTLRKDDRGWVIRSVK